MNTDFHNLLFMGLDSNLEKRESAEYAFDKMVTENFPNFLLNCAETLADESCKKEIRQLSATLIKNVISKKKHEGRWETMDEESKDKIKNYILSCLASKYIEVRKSTAFTVAGKIKI